MQKLNEDIKLKENSATNLDELFTIKKLPITSKEKKGIFEAWIESSDL